MRYEELPPRISEYIGSYYTTLKNVRMANRYRLSGDKLEEFARTVGRTFLKEFKVEELPQQLTDNLGLERGTALLLAAEVADQHLLNFEDFFGPISDLRNRWRQWGREFGGKQPAPKAEARVEKLIAQAGQAPGLGFEFTSMPSRRAATPVVAPKIQPGRQARVAVRQRETAPQPVAEQRVVLSEQTKKAFAPADQSKNLTNPVKIIPKTAPAKPRVFVAPPRQAESTATPAQTTADRERFLNQLKTVAIESVRTPGQSGAPRIKAMGDRLQQVIANEPTDRSALSAALRVSPLYKLYAELGQEVIRAQKPLDQVIYDRFTQKRPYLVKDEFEAVAALMKSIQ
jgi:hypothetical protein